MPDRSPSSPRCAALVGPHLAGKSMLFRALMRATNSPELDERAALLPSTTLTVANTTYLDERWCFIDCPGSIDFLQDTLNALKIVDLAIVVCEPDTNKVITLAPFLHFLDQNDIPHVIFINKIDEAKESIKSVMEAVRRVSDRGLLLRELPFREDGKIAGFVDLVSERAWHYSKSSVPDRVDIPSDMQEQEQDARLGLVEFMADFDDGIMESFLDDIMPTSEELYGQIAAELRGDELVPLFFGSAKQDHGVHRLLKSLRHDSPGVEATAERLGLSETGTLARVFKTSHEPFVGKMNYARVLRGDLSAGELALGDSTVRVGILQDPGRHHKRLARAALGEVVAIAKTKPLRTGHLVGSELDDAEEWCDTLLSVYGLVVTAQRQRDEMKLSEALHELVQDDPSLTLDHGAATHEMVLRGRGELHLKTAIERLEQHYKILMESRPARIAYRETIRESADQQARYKKQTGGHGQFAEVHMRISPNERGEGLTFSQSVVGGTVPKRFIPGVEKGVREFMRRGPLGFPVVDVCVDLYDGKAHQVDSSEQAFRTAAMQAMREGTRGATPVLLEPVHRVAVCVPNQFTSSVRRMITSHRGQFVAFEARDGWTGWDQIVVDMPESDMQSLIRDVRALTQGVGTYTADFHGLNELSGRLAQQVIEDRRQELKR
ncbi:MAG: elongation factor G [Kiritimatiellia bacterium]|jgi:elongation factor G